MRVRARQQMLLSPAGTPRMLLYPCSSRLLAGEAHRPASQHRQSVQVSAPVVQCTPGSRLPLQNFLPLLRFGLLQGSCDHREKKRTGKKEQ